MIYELTCAFSRSTELSLMYRLASRILNPHSCLMVLQLIIHHVRRTTYIQSIHTVLLSAQRLEVRQSWYSICILRAFLWFVAP